MWAEEFIFVYVVRKCYNFIFLQVDVQFPRFPCGSTGKEYTCSAGDLGSIHGFGRSPGEGKAYPLQYSGLENSIDYLGEKERYTHLNAEFQRSEER